MGIDISTDVRTDVSTDVSADVGADETPDVGADVGAEHGVDWSALPPPAPGLRCSVVLPARNEAVLVTRALQALTAQVGAGHFEVIVLANNCTDDTAERARAFAATCSHCSIHVCSVVWPKSLANVGRARRALFDEAARRIRRAGTPRGVLASTDADTRVAPDWLAQTFAAIDAGADAVGGRIVTDPDPSLPAEAQRLMRLDDCYQRWRVRLEDLSDPDRGDPWPRHHQHFGASLAVTADAYCAVGGQPLVPHLEDEALVQALYGHDKTVRHHPAVQVRTSARLDGRADVGLSWQLRQWADFSAAAAVAGRVVRCPAVPDPVDELHLWRLRRWARQLWGTAQGVAKSTLLNDCKRWLQAGEALAPGQAAAVTRAATFDEPSVPLAASQLLQHMRNAPTFGSLWATLGPQMVDGYGARLPMDLALSRLRLLVAAERKCRSTT